MIVFSEWIGDSCRCNSTTKQCLMQQKTGSASDFNPGAERSSSLSSGGYADSCRCEILFINDLEWGPVTPHYRHPSSACSSFFIFHHQSSSAEPVIRTYIDSWSICFVRLRKNTAGCVYTSKGCHMKVCGCIWEIGKSGRVPSRFLTLLAVSDSRLRNSFPLGTLWQWKSLAFPHMAGVSDFAAHACSHWFASCSSLCAYCEPNEKVNSFINPPSFFQGRV